MSEFVAPCLGNAILRWTMGALLLASTASAQVNILTNRYDEARTGANLSETKLTAGNVSVDQFGKLYSYPVSGSVYAQPLYVRNVVIGGAAHNVLYVATMNDKVYAFDADSSSPTPLWTRDLAADVGGAPIPIVEITGSNSLNIVGNVGIQSTPVIDVDATTGAKTIYLVARTKEAGAYVQRLHALDIATGASRPGSGVVITASVEGTNSDAVNGVITFNPKMQSQRAGLAVSNGVVLIAWAAHEDFEPYHGWIMGYDSSTFAQVAAWPITRDAFGGGIWQGGRAPTIDGSYAYFGTGNGIWDGGRNLSDSLLKFFVSRSGLTLVDSFTPGNETDLNAHDWDLSGSGFTLLPGNLLVGGGKEGVLYVLNGANLGGKGPVGDPQIPQRISVRGGHVMGGIVYWQSAAQGPLVFNWSEDDVLKTYSFTGGKLSTTPTAQGQVVSPGHPGGSLTLTANGGATGTGIVWASMPTLQDGIHGKVAGVLRAFDAETLREIWSSEENPTRDRVGTLMKFVPPVVVNGRVYLPNHDGQVAVYGRISVSPPDFTLAVTPSSKTIPAGGTDTFSVTVTAKNGFTGSVALSASGQPAGVTVGFNPSSVTASGTSTMTVSVPATASGTFSITVKGVSGALTHTATASVATATPAPAGSIGINFVGTSPTPMGAAETAGVVPQSHWNNATGGTNSTPLALVDKAGAATSATVTWSAYGIWMTPIADTAGNARMMKGYLDTSTTSTTTVTVAGLAQRTYDVYVYADGDNKAYSRTAAYTISGTGITSTTIALTDAPNTNYGGAFTRATNSTGNYVKFSITAAGFTLSATGTEPVDATRRAPINAIQIVPVASTAPDFSLSVTPSSRSVTQGGSTTYTVTVTPVNGFTGTVTLGLSGAPGGTTTTFNPTTIAGSGSSTVTLATSASTPAGSSTLTFKGTSGALSHTRTASLTVSAAGGGTPAGSIGINFVGSSPTPMAATETAGVIAQPNWNNATGATGSGPLALVDRSGAATSATVTWSAPGGTYQTGISDAAGNLRMMKGYLDTSSSSTTTVSVAGLAQRTYDVYVYADGANGANNRSGDYTISGTGITATTVRLIDAASTNFSGTFTRANNSAGNYVQFTVTASAFTITAKPVGTAGTTLRAPINGVQIVPVVVPTSSAIGINFVGSSPTPMAATETAGVVDQSNWNNAAGAASSAPLALVDASGAASPATVTWKANGAWSLPITDTAGNRRMMRGYLDTGTSTTTLVTVAGLASGEYDVYVYVDGDNKDLTRTASYMLSSGPSSTVETITDPASTNFAGTFVEAVGGGSGNYLRYHFTGDGFTLIARPSTSTNTTLRAPVNAIQIVPR